MTAPRLPELTARVVAWHNRHPLARRIDATQVHSIGEVRLPFASAAPWNATLAVPPAAPPAQAPDADHAAPTLAEALAQRNNRQPSVPAADASGIEGLDVQSMLPEADADLLMTPTAAPAPAAAADIDLALDAPDDDSDDDGEAALVIPLLDGDDTLQPDTAAPADLAEASTATAGDDDGHAGPQAAPAAAAAAAPAPQTTPAPTQATADPATPEFPDVYPPPHGSVPASALARAVERRAAARGAAAAVHPAPQHLGEPPAPGRWRRLVDALRLACGRQPGLPPLRAAFSRDFIWPLRPGQVARWAQRHGQPQALAPADWPRRSIETDRPRLAALRQKGLAHDLPLHVLTAAIGVGDRRMRVLLGADGSILGPRAYSQARVGSAATLLALGLVAAGWSLRPLHGTGADGGAAVLATLAASASVAAAAASVPLLPASAADAVASAAAQADAAASAAAGGDAETSTAAAPDEAASQPQAAIRPLLSDDEKYAAKVEAARLRGEPAPAPPPEAITGPVYAVVSPPSQQRDAAANSLVLMKSAANRLAGPVPAHGELVQSQGQWRAAWWPFASLVDAERARVLLGGRGLKAEVVEF